MLFRNYFKEEEYTLRPNTIKKKTLNRYKRFNSMRRSADTDEKLRRLLGTLFKFYATTFNCTARTIMSSICVTLSICFNQPNSALAM